MLFSKIFSRCVCPRAQYYHALSYVLTIDLQRTKVVIWLYDNIEMRIEGRIVVRDLTKLSQLCAGRGRHEQWAFLKTFPYC